MRINGIKGMVFGIAATTVAVVGLSCGGGTAGGGTGEGGRTTLRLGIVVETPSGVEGVQGASIWAVVNIGDQQHPHLVKVSFTANASDPAVYELVSPPPGLVGFFVVPPTAFYQVCQWPYVGRITGGLYQFPTDVPFDPAKFAYAPLTGPFTGGAVNNEGLVRVFPTSGGPPPLPDFP